MEIKKIRLADELGLGNGKQENIDILGEDVSDEDWGFEVGRSLVIWGDQLFHKGPLSFMEPLLFHTPLFKLPILGSAVYHDYFWYPIVGKRKIREFMKTEWGKLFKKYSRRGTPDER